MQAPIMQSSPKPSPVETKNEPSTNLFYNEEDNDNTNILINYKDSTGKYIYMIFHIIMSFIAVYLSWKCNGGKFDLLSFLIGLFFPYIYIIYILATRGTCDA
jgi:hypothetical protein